jgi:hypothetical protein
MKAYRVQARMGGKYLDTKLNAANDVEALEKFSKLVSEGNIETYKDDFCNNKQVHITYEELNNESQKNRVVETTSTS